MKNSNKDVQRSFDSAFKHSDYPGKRIPTPDGGDMPVPKPSPKTASKARKKGSGNAKGGGKPSKPQDFYPNGALPRTV